MNLKKGVQLYSNIPNIGDQLKINSGAISGISDELITYQEESYIPKNDWRDISLSDEKMIMSRIYPSKIHNRIIVGTIPPPLRKSFLELNLHEVQSTDDVLPRLRENEGLVRKISMEVNAFFLTISLDKTIRFHRITRSPPNLDTVTCHYTGNGFIYTGLHIDRSRDFTPHSAYKSGSRVSINLSKESRTLLYINLSLRQIVNLLKTKNGIIVDDINTDNIVKLFFLNYPNYPVIRLKLKPYQYYVAPTDNFIHDGSTLNNKNIDVTVVYTGIFNYKIN